MPAINYFRILAGCTGVVESYHHNGNLIEKRVTGYAYPRNGNAHNPTPRIRWDVRSGGSGRLLGRFATKREAKAFLEGPA